MSELALKLIRECKETRATRLDLGNCGLTELPEELFELVWLEELILSPTYEIWDYNTRELIRYSTQNNLGKNRLLFLPNKIGNLHNLRLLFLNHNHDLKNFKILRNLTNLRQLNIHNTSVYNLSWVVNLINLEFINISNTTVSNIKDIENLINLKGLNISSTKVEFIDPLKNLVGLQFIDLNTSNVTSINNLQRLKNLNRLNVSFNHIYNIEPIQELINLESLSLHRIKINDVIPLSKLYNLKRLNISYNLINSIEPLSNLNNLINLDIYNTLVNDLMPIKHLIAKGIQVNINKKIKDIEAINAQNTPIINPPLEIVKQGNNAIINYWKQLGSQGSTVDLYEAKLIIVGEGATGKTTLFEKLKDNNHQVGNTPETHGINIHEGLPFIHTHIEDNIFRTNLWDFGGQELQYMTHQFFLTPRALYVLMMDARRESPNLAYWFKIISLLGRDREDSTEKVRLLLVFNKRGNSTGTPPQYQDQLKYYEDSLDVHYLEVDFAENDYRFENLQNCIKKSLVTLPIVKSQLPRLWKVVREDLREEAKTESYITTKRFSDICSKHGITEEADQWLLSGYLHQLGSLLHFQNDKGLRRLVILSPQWAVDGVYTFLSDESIARNNGRFTEEAFIALLATKGYNRDDADVILQLMTKNNFDICYEATEGNYVAAQLLPDNAPQYKWFPKEVLQFRYQYPIMPKGLMSRLIVRLSDNIERDKDSNEQIVWKKGVVLYIKLKEGECRVRLREDDAESKAGLRQILIDVMGEQDARKYALRKVRDTVDDLHKKWFRSIKADEMVPCCCSECKISDNPQLYKLENLLKRRLKRPDTSCDVSGEDLMIQQLLEGVYDKNEIRDMGLI